MLRLRDRPDKYTWLDAAQLIKHAFGLARSFPDRPVTLLYLFWKPANPTADPEFVAHRDEIEEFRARVAGSSPAFEAMSTISAGGQGCFECEVHIAEYDRGPPITHIEQNAGRWLRGLSRMGCH